MVQDLVETSGPAVRMALVRQSHMGAMHMTMRMEGKPSPYAMSHMGAQVKVTFPTAGVYQFRLVDRGDYVANIKTVGPDNKPTLRSPSPEAGLDERPAGRRSGGASRFFSAASPLDTCAQSSPLPPPL
jgi:hypothetical protein